MDTATRLPLKVWRNRQRGNNEALRPDIELKAAMHDDGAVRAAALAALKPYLRTAAPE